MEQLPTLYSRSIETPLGQMIAIADEDALFLLEFADFPHLKQEIEWLRISTGARIQEGHSPILDLINQELTAYFEGKLTTFTTPIFLLGSSFQRRTWQALRAIDYGTTKSYTEIAQFVGKASAFRAVAQANAANRLTIIIPCHRVIAADGSLSGYNNGIQRKEWLLSHEKKHAKSDNETVSSYKNNAHSSCSSSCQ